MVINREICVKDFSRTTVPRLLKFDTSIGNHVVLCEKESAFSCLSFPLFVHFSFSLFKIAVTDFSAPMRARVPRSLSTSFERQVYYGPRC